MARKKLMPHYPIDGVAVHGDSRIAYHGERAECEKRRPELQGLYEAYGKPGKLSAEPCPHCKAFVVIRLPQA